MRKLILGLAAGTALTLGSAANATLFIGGATGCFVAPGPGSCAPGPVSIDAGLTYQGGLSTFAQLTDANGFAAIGGPANNFGTITLVPNAHDYSQDLFNLMVTLVLPAAGSGSYTANLLGSFTALNTGGVQITFQNPDQIISTAAGNFTLHVNNVAFSGSTQLTQDINGYILAPVPEPGTWAMMLLGFGGIGLAMRRRRRRALAQIA